jgi:hypothetical protein
MMRPPAVLLASFWAYITTAVLVFVAGMTLFLNRTSALDSLRTSSVGRQLSEAQLQQAATGGLVLGMALAVLFAALFGILAFRLQAGRNWARVTLSVLAAVNLVAIVFTAGTTPLGYLADGVALVAAVLSYLPPANTFIRQAA